MEDLVSCIMPTYNRRRFVAQAIKYFLRQDYEAKELIVVDDGTDEVGDLIPADDRMSYIRLQQRLTIGAKRNLACEQARGEIIAHWDDDDWMASYRLRYQVESLLREGTDLCGINKLLYYDIKTGRAWQYRYPADQRNWLSGNALCYRRAFWEKNRFEEIDIGEDTRFVWSARPDRMTALADITYHVGIIHSQNVSPKHTQGSYWGAYPVEEIKRLLGADWDFYQPESNQMPDGSRLASDGNLEAERREIGMITTAKADDLALPEYAAFNHGQSLPWMRRWELPFVLFQSRLSNTASVLDCTINPVNFSVLLARLYPHVLYRHWSPIQQGRFVLPLGVPDEAFDRVICVNTLEHLLKPQREALIREMARKLKPGGWLALTSDYYFDSFWEQPAFLKAGVMRADRQEIFNGYNKVTPQEWLDLCQRYDLHPLSGTMEEPLEDDPTLYRNQGIHPHACMAGVFHKSHHEDLNASKKIVLALLVWNTREVSIDSVRAILREARMLRRLGQLPFICVCDNGSTDGTPEALRAVESLIDVPYKVIYNRENLGNSIARNQIIDYMLECGADYLLLMDGDIEMVPFSGFAMLRYMENCGHRLGCIGADSAGQTPFRERTSPYLYSLDGHRIESINLVAWTQYGMFRRAVFEDGVRFDESGPFDGVGWGFEDNDLSFQMEMKGYLNQRFFGMTYLHRNARSSIRIMHERGIDAYSLYTRRRQYVIDKWAAVPHINNGPLSEVRRASIRM